MPSGRRRCVLIVGTRREHRKVEYHFARLLRYGHDLYLILVALADLLQQRQRVVVVDEAHHFAAMQLFQRTENGGMAETLGDATGVKQVNGRVLHGCDPQG